MNTKKRLFASALLIALAAAGVLIRGCTDVAKAQQGPAQVSIVGPVPLPITGNATVSGTVAATQSGTWNVNLAGSTGALTTQDLSTFAAQNVLLQNRVSANNPAAVGLLDLSSTGAFSNCCYGVPVAQTGQTQTLVVTSVDITPVTPGTGTNHITLLGSLGGAAPEPFRSFEVSNASSTHLDYPTGIAFGSNERIFVLNGVFLPGSAVSAGDVDIYLQGYLTIN